MNLSIMWDAVPKLLAGVPVTLQLVLLALLFGFVLAAGVALMRLSGNRIASAFAAAYVFVFRGTPLLVQIFLIYYGLGPVPGGPVQHLLGRSCASPTGAASWR